MLCRKSPAYVTWLVHVCCDWFMCVTWLIHNATWLFDGKSWRVMRCRKSPAYVMWHIHVFDVAHSYVWCDTFTCVMCLFICGMLLIHMCDVIHSHVSRDSTPSYAWHDSFMRELMPHSHVWYEWFICVMWLTHMCSVTHSYFTRCTANGKVSSVCCPVD